MAGKQIVQSVDILLEAREELIRRGVSPGAARAMR